MFRFTHNGRRVAPEDSPLMLDLKDNDQIDVKQLVEIEESDAMITIQVRDGRGDITHFKMKKSTQMDKIFSAYADHRGTIKLLTRNSSHDQCYLEIRVSHFRFVFRGRRIRPHETPKMLGLEDDDLIDVMLETTS